MNEIENHQNPTILRSVRNQVDATTTMHKYYGEIKRNADAAYVLCGKCEGCEVKE